MSIFACIYGFFHCSCTENSVYVHDTRRVQNASSNRRYLIPSYLRMVGGSMRDAGMAHDVWICSRNSLCHLYKTLRIQRPALTVLHCTRWQEILPTVPLAPGMAQHPNVHTDTHKHTGVRKHTHPIGSALADQYARKPQGLVSRCFQTRPNSSYRNIFCTAGRQAAIYFGSKPKRKTRSPCLRESLREEPKSHARPLWKYVKAKSEMR